MVIRTTTPTTVPAITGAGLWITRLDAEAALVELVSELATAGGVEKEDDAGTVVDEASLVLVATIGGVGEDEDDVGKAVGKSPTSRTV